MSSSGDILRDTPDTDNSEIRPGVDEVAALAVGGEAALELELTAPPEKVIIPPISDEARDEMRAELEGPRRGRVGGPIPGPSGMISIGRKGRGRGGWDDH